MNQHKCVTGANEAESCWKTVKLLHREAGAQTSERFPFIAWYAYRIWHMSMTEVVLWRSYHGQKGVWVQKVVSGTEGSTVLDRQIPGR